MWHIIGWNELGKIRWSRHMPGLKLANAILIVSEEGRMKTWRALEERDVM